MGTRGAAAFALARTGLQLVLQPRYARLGLCAGTEQRVHDRVSCFCFLALVWLFEVRWAFADGLERVDAASGQAVISTAAAAWGDDAACYDGDGGGGGHRSCGCCATRV